MEKDAFTFEHANSDILSKSTPIVYEIVSQL